MNSVNFNRPKEKRSLLLVDDNEENRIVLRSFLKNENILITEAIDGKEAINAFHEGHFDLILMDMQMPVMDGLSATAEIRKLEQERNLEETPIVALTASDTKEDIERSLHAGCYGHLSKPIAKAILIETIKAYTAEFSVSISKDISDLIPDYLEGRRTELVKLREALSKKDYAALSVLGHKLRGTAGSYGLAKLSDIGKDIEEKAMVSDLIGLHEASAKYRLFMKLLRIRFE